MISPTIIILVDKLLFSSVPVIALGFIARYYNLDEFAFASFWLSMYSIALTVIAISYEPVLYEALGKRFYGKIKSIFVISFAVACIFSITIFSISRQSVVGAQNEELYVIVLVSLFVPLYLFEALMRYNRIYSTILKIRVLVTTFLFLIKVYIVNHGIEFFWFFSIVLFELITVPIVVFFIILLKTGYVTRIAQAKMEIKCQIVSEIILVGLSAGLVIFYTRLPQIMLVGTDISDQIALFNSAFLITNSLNIVTASMYLRYMRNSISTYQNNTDRYYEQTAKALAIISLSGFLLVPCLAIFAPLIQNVFFPIGYQADKMLYVYLGIYLVIITSALVRSQLIVILKLQKINFLSAVIAIIVVYFHAKYVQDYTSNEAAKGLMVSALLSGVLTSFLFPQLRKFGKLQIQSFFPYKIKKVIKT